MKLTLFHYVTELFSNCFLGFYQQNDWNELLRLDEQRTLLKSILGCLRFSTVNDFVIVVIMIVNIIIINVIIFNIININIITITFIYILLLH